MTGTGSTLLDRIDEATKATSEAKEKIEHSLEPESRGPTQSLNAELAYFLSKRLRLIAGGLSVRGWATEADGLRNSVSQCLDASGIPRYHLQETADGDLYLDCGADQILDDAAMILRDAVQREELRREREAEVEETRIRAAKDASAAAQELERAKLDLENLRLNVEKRRDGANQDFENRKYFYGLVFTGVGIVVGLLAAVAPEFSKAYLAGRSKAALTVLSGELLAQSGAPPPAATVECTPHLPGVFAGAGGGRYLVVLLDETPKPPQLVCRANAPGFRSHEFVVPVPKGGSSQIANLPAVTLSREATRTR